MSEQHVLFPLACLPVYLPSKCRVRPGLWLRLADATLEVMLGLLAPMSRFRLSLLLLRVFIFRSRSIELHYDVDKWLVAFTKKKLGR